MFLGVKGMGGPIFSVFLHTFRVFLQKSHYQFMKVVKIEYSVLKDS